MPTFKNHTVLLASTCNPWIPRRTPCQCVQIAGDQSDNGSSVLIRQGNHDPKATKPTEVLDASTQWTVDFRFCLVKCCACSPWCLVGTDIVLWRDNRQRHLGQRSQSFSFQRRLLCSGLVPGWIVCRWRRKEREHGRLAIWGLWQGWRCLKIRIAIATIFSGNFWGRGQTRCHREHCWLICGSHPAASDKQEIAC